MGSHVDINTQTSNKATVTAYNGYAETYGNRFNALTPLPFHEENTLKANFANVCRYLRDTGQDTIRLLDHGCGNGIRFMKMYREMARTAYIHGLNFELTGYDISTEMLDEFQKKIESDNEKHNTPAQKIISKDGKVTTYSSPMGSKTHNIRLVDGDENDTISLTKQKLGGNNSHHIIIAMYGVISHVSSAQTRDEVFSMLQDMCEHHFACTVAGYGRFKEERNKFEELRKHYEQETQPESKQDKEAKIKAAKEYGDLYYAPTNGAPVEIFYHTFYREELRSHMIRAGFENIQVGISTITPPVFLSQRRWANITEGVIVNWVNHITEKVQSPILDTILEKCANISSYIIGTASSDTLQKYIQQNKDRSLV